VIAYVSSIHVDPDLAVEIFVMEPLDDPLAEEPASTDGADPASADGDHPQGDFA
jgi:hypothetical protein